MSQTLSQTLIGPPPASFRECCLDDAFWLLNAGKLLPAVRDQLVNCIPDIRGRAEQSKLADLEALVERRRAELKSCSAFRRVFAAREFDEALTELEAL